MRQVLRLEPSSFIFENEYVVEYLKMDQDPLFILQHVDENQVILGQDQQDQQDQDQDTADALRELLVSELLGGRMVKFQAIHQDQDQDQDQDNDQGLEDETEAFRLKFYALSEEGARER